MSIGSLPQFLFYLSLWNAVAGAYVNRGQGGFFSVVVGDGSFKLYWGRTVYLKKGSSDCLP